MVLPVTVADNPTKFHENHLETVRVILLTDKWTPAKALPPCKIDLKNMLQMLHHGKSILNCYAVITTSGEVMYFED